MRDPPPNASTPEVRSAQPKTNQMMKPEAITYIKDHGDQNLSCHHQHPPQQENIHQTRQASPQDGAAGKATEETQAWTEDRNEQQKMRQTTHEPPAQTTRK